ncbi:hypothetical protein UFOVP1376_8 [uncultured Caudovirales phage]|uniref:Uncharacterized protein n=2 Tax=uncultured Caudovirales phage TaxID=2100421 RepID=A0A6J5RYV6_9CAUD|nr:hypothetical protein UFOVP1376_8 [uncultured Caudovirales phage]
MTPTRAELLAMCDDVLKMYPDEDRCHYTTLARALKSMLLAQPTRGDVIDAIKNGRASIFDDPCVKDDTPHIADAIIALYTPKRPHTRRPPHDPPHLYTRRCGRSVV